MCSISTSCTGVCRWPNALRIAETVEVDIEGATYSVASADALEPAEDAGHPTYACEYVALAQELNLPLVTGDETIADLFPDTAVLLEEYASA